METSGADNTLNPLNVELNPIRHLLPLVGARHIVHVSRMRVNRALNSREKKTETNEWRLHEQTYGERHLVKLYV